MNDDQERGPNNHLNRATMWIRKACEELHNFRAEFPPGISRERQSMFCENFKAIAAFEAADIVCHLLQHARRQIGKIRDLNKDKW